MYYVSPVGGNSRAGIETPSFQGDLDVRPSKMCKSLNDNRQTHLLELGYEMRQNERRRDGAGLHQAAFANSVTVKCPE